MADYLVQEDGSSKFLLEDASGDLLLEQQAIVVPFISSVTVVYTPSLPVVPVPFISSVTAVHAPSLSTTTVITAVFGGPPFGWAFFGEGIPSVAGAPQTATIPFISSVTSVFAPALLLELDLPFISSVTVVYAPSVVIDISVPFIGSATVVYAPTLQRTYVEAPFIGSVTVVYTPSLQRTYIDAPFIPSVTFVYPPTLKIAFTGGGVSQVALEVLTSDGEPNAQVSQVTLEIIVPMYKGLHVWQRS